MFHYLTEGVQEPFLKPELADRLAAMLGMCKHIVVKLFFNYLCTPTSHLQ